MAHRPADDQGAEQSTPPKRARRVTSRDVAEQAGVSRSTVSLILNNTPGINIPAETRLRVIRTAQELGYTPNAAARSLATSQSHLLGFVLCQSTEQVFADAFLPQVILGVNSAATAQGYRVLVQPVEDVSQPGTYVHLMREQRIDGIILSGPRSDDRQLDELREQNFPVVLLGQLHGTAFPSVDVDNVKGAALAVEHLLRLGYRHIGMITNAPPQYTASIDRIQGYRQALEKYEVAFHEEHIFYGNFTEESGYAAMHALLEHYPWAEAVFIASDVVAYGALAAVRDRGRSVPDDLAIVGFDDARLSRYSYPPLTTVRLPAHDLGYHAGIVLIQLIQGESVPSRPLLLETELVIRDSCGASRMGKRR